MKCGATDIWPEIIKDIKKEVKFAVQVNGKTRDIIIIDNNLSKKQVNEIIIKKSKAKKFIENKNILKTIFVENKIMNYIVK